MASQLVVYTLPGLKARQVGYLYIYIVHVCGLAICWGWNLPKVAQKLNVEAKLLHSHTQLGDEFSKHKCRMSILALEKKTFRSYVLHPLYHALLYDTTTHTHTHTHTHTSTCTSNTALYIHTYSTHVLWLASRMPCACSMTHCGRSFSRDCSRGSVRGQGTNNLTHNVLYGDKINGGVNKQMFRNKKSITDSVIALQPTQQICAFKEL